MLSAAGADVVYTKKLKEELDYIPKKLLYGIVAVTHMVTYDNYLGFLGLLRFFRDFRLRGSFCELTVFAATSGADST